MSDNKSKAPFQTSQEGTGSAENRGQERNQQQAQNTKLNQQERQDIGDQLGSDKNRVADLDDLGMNSGRDDNAGGSGDQMEDQSTGQGTDR
jgi:hypothetical protein